MRTIELTQGYVTTVDDSDYDNLILNKWNYSRGRAVRTVSNSDGSKSTIRMHREIMGVTDPKIKIDHRNGEPLCNERWNLRESTNSQNGMNRPSNAVNKSSQYKGVHWDKKRSKWQAQIKLNYKNVHLGRFDNEIDAALAYNNKAKELHGEFAHLNVIK